MISKTHDNRLRIMRKRRQCSETLIVAASPQTTSYNILYNNLNLQAITNLYGKYHFMSEQSNECSAPALVHGPRCISTLYRKVYKERFSISMTLELAPVYSYTAIFL